MFRKVLSNVDDISPGNRDFSYEEGFHEAIITTCGHRVLKQSGILMINDVNST